MTGKGEAMKARKTGSGTRDLIRPDLRQLAGYTAVEPVERLVKDGDTGQPGIESRPTVKLDANENPYGPSPRVLRAIAGSSALHVYPDAEQRNLRTALGDYVGLGAEHIVVGNGSDDILDLITRLTLEPGDRVINCTPTFGMYKFVTEVSGGVLVEVSRNDHYGLDLDAIEKSIDDRTKIVFIASPNNPTGNSSSRDEIVRLLETGLAVVVDEAYFEFSGQTMASLVPDYDNLMVVRTFSKWAGLAGVRVGYGIFSPRIAGYINQIKQPYNVSVFAQMAALESLADRDYLMANVKAIIRERERLFGEIERLDFLRPMPSEGNYILCDVTRGDAGRLYERLKERRVFVRYYDRPNLRNCIRISVGKPEDTEALLEALRAVGEENDAK